MFRRNIKTISDDIFHFLSHYFFFSRGVIHVGDRLLAINGQALLGLSREDVVLLLKHAHDQVSLQIEYDVYHKGKICCLN